MACFSHLLVRGLKHCFNINIVCHFLYTPREKQDSPVSKQLPVLKKNFLGLQNSNFKESP